MHLFIAPRPTGDPLIPLFCPLCTSSCVLVTSSNPQPFSRLLPNTQMFRRMKEPGKYPSRDGLARECKDPLQGCRIPYIALAMPRVLSSPSLRHRQNCSLSIRQSIPYLLYLHFFFSYAILPFSSTLNIRRADSQRTAPAGSAQGHSTSPSPDRASRSLSRRGSNTATPVLGFSPPHADTPATSQSPCHAHTKHTQPLITPNTL